MSRGRSATTTKVFVGSLPAGVTVDDLRRLFEPYGGIAECDISNRCGFLHMEDRDLAMKAIEELNGSDFMGGRISVERGRIKPRRNGGGPMRGGKERAGPYTRDFRGGPPQRNGGGRDMPNYGGGDRFGGGGPGYDRPQPRGGYDGGYGDRRPPPPPFEDRRGGGFGNERRPYGGSGYNDRPPYDDRSGPYPEPRGGMGGGYNDRRPTYDDRNERRPLMEPRMDRRPLMDAAGSRGSYDRPNAPPVDLFSRRDQGGGKPNYGGGSNGYSSSGGGGGYSSGGGSSYSQSSQPYGYSTNPSGGYDTRGAHNSGYSQGGGGGGYGDSYSSSGGRSYDESYPPLPTQRGYASGGGPGGGPRRDMAQGRRY